MLIYVSVVLLFLKGALSLDEECRQRVVSNNKEGCKGFDRFPGIPETKEELDHACQVITPFFRCSVEVFDTCEKDEYDPSTERITRKSLPFLETRLCNENSDLYRVVSSNLHCIKDSFPDMMDRCHPDTAVADPHNGLPNLLEDSVLQHIPGGPEDAEFMSCFEGILMATCGSLHFEQICGHDVGDAFLATVLNLSVRLDDCPPELLKQMPVIVKAISTSLDEKKRR